MKQNKKWSIIRGRNYSGFKILFKRYYNFQISEQFIACMDAQLSDWLPHFLGLPSVEFNDYDCLNWSPEIPLIYERGVISKMSAKIFLNSPSFDIHVLWQANTGKIYLPSDEAVECRDITFWIEGLDKDLCLYYKHPDNTLYFSIYHWIRRFKTDYNLELSIEFMQCANKQLTADFIRQTGISSFKQVAVVTISNYKIHYPHWEHVYERAEISIIPLWASICAHCTFGVSYMCWKSKSGRIYDVSDTDIDPNDIIFWYEGLKPEEYRKILYPNEPFPLSLKDLKFEFEFVRLDMDSNISLQFKDESMAKDEGLIGKIDDFIQKKCIDNPIKITKDYEGRAHKFSRSFKAPDTWVYVIDTGSGGYYVIKKFIQFLNKLDCLCKVVVE